MSQGKKWLPAFIPSLSWPWTQARLKPLLPNWALLGTLAPPHLCSLPSCSLLSWAANGWGPTQILLSQAPGEQETCHLRQPANQGRDSQQGERKDSATPACDRGNQPSEQPGLSHGSQAEIQHSYQINPLFLPHPLAFYRIRGKQTRHLFFFFLRHISFLRVKSLWRPKQTKKTKDEGHES